MTLPPTFILSPENLLHHQAVTSHSNAAEHGGSLKERLVNDIALSASATCAVNSAIRSPYTVHFHISVLLNSALMSSFSFSGIRKRI